MKNSIWHNLTMIYKAKTTPIITALFLLNSTYELKKTLRPYGA